MEQARKHYHSEMMMFRDQKDCEIVEIERQFQRISVEKDERIT